MAKIHGSVVVSIEQYKLSLLCGVACLFYLLNQK